MEGNVNRPAAVPGASKNRRLRVAFTVLSIGALVMVLISVAMFGIALAFGVHCPECARVPLGEGYEFWRGYFRLIDFMHLIGGVVALVSLPFAHRRRYSVYAMCLACLLLARPS